MSIWWILRTEIRRILRSKIGRAAVLAGMVIPLLYSGLYLYAFWNPYNHMNEFPVALVNADQGGVKDNKSVNYGHDLVDRMTKDHSFDWQVVSEADAKSGLEGNKYYLMVKIPPTFTKDALSVTGDSPHRAELQFVPNEGKNYIAATISTRLETSLREEVGNEFSKQYFDGIFAVIGDAGNGLSKAASGAGQLADGATNLHQGAVQLHSGTTQLNSGASQLASGTAQVADGSRQLAGGIAQANAGAAKALSGASQLQTGANELSAKLGQLAGGLKQSTAGVQQVRDQLNGSLPGLGQMQGGLMQMQGVLGTLGADEQPPVPTTQDPSQMSAVQLLVLVEQQYHLEHNAAFQGALQKISGVSNQLGTVAGQVGQSKTGLGQATVALDQIAGSQTTMVTGANQLASGSQQLAQGANSLQSGLTDLHTGTATLATKSNELATGAQKTADGSRDVARGTASLADGSSKLVDGAQKLANGNRTLAGNLADATKNSTVNNSDQKSTIMSDPVQINYTAVHPVSTYGMGLASYFIPLALWVGAFMLFFLLSKQEYRWTIAPVSSVSIVLGKFLTLGVLGVLQAVITSLVLTQVVGLHVLHLPQFYLFNILFSVTSIAIIGLLIARLGSGPGRFLAIVLLILQLTSSAGTFPLELVPRFFKAIHPYLPMSYGVEGLRAIVATGDLSNVGTDTLVLACILVGVLLIEVLTTRRTLKVKDLHEKDVLVS